MLEVSWSGVGTMLRLESHAWSVVKTNQGGNKRVYPPPTLRAANVKEFGQCCSWWICVWVSLAIFRPQRFARCGHLKRATGIDVEVLHQHRIISDSRPLNTARHQLVLFELWSWLFDTFISCGSWVVAWRNTWETLQTLRISQPYFGLCFAKMFQYLLHAALRYTQIDCWTLKENTWCWRFFSASASSQSLRFVRDFSKDCNNA